MAEEQTPTNLFEEEDPAIHSTEELFADPSFPQTPQITASQIDVTAKLAAVGQRNHEPTVDFDELVQQNRNIIAAGEELVLRREAQLRQAEMRRNALQELGYDAMYNGRPDEATAFVDLEINPDALAAGGDYNQLEKEAVAELQNAEMLEDPDYGSAIQEQFAENTGATLDVLRDEATKSLIFQRKLAEYHESIKRRGLDKLTKRIEEGAAIMFLPFYDTQSRINVRTNEDVEVEGIDRVRAGAAIKRQIEGLWALPLDQFETEVETLFDDAARQSGIFGENETAAIHILEQYSKGTHGVGGVILDDMVGLVDSIPVAAALFRVGSRSVISAAQAAKFAGARKTSAILDAKALNETVRAAAASGDEVAEDSVQAVSDLIPKALKPGIAEPGVGISGSLAAKLEEIEAVGEELAKITTQGRLSDEQMKILVDNTVERIRESATYRIEDIATRVDEQTGLGAVDVFVGKKAGGGFATELSARGQAARMGFEKGAFDIVEDNGYFFIRQTHTVEEIGRNGMPLIRRPDNSIELYPDTGPIRAGVQNPDLSMPRDLAVRRHESELAEIKFRENITKKLAKFIAPLNKKDMKALNTIMTKGRNEKRWFTIDEFALEWEKTTKAPMKEYHFTAYAAAVQANNVDHAVRNIHVFAEEARRGTKTISVFDARNPIDKVNGIERNLSVEEAAKLRLYDFEDRITRMPGAADIEKADLARKLESGQYKIIALDKGVVIDGDPVHTILAPISKVTIAPLSRQQVKYVPGGHYIRRTKFFGKQAVVGEYKDGTKYVDRPRALYAYRTERAGREHLKEINGLLEKYRAYRAGQTAGPSVGNALGRVALRREFANSPFGSLDDFEKLVQEGKFDYTRDVELVYDRGLPREYWETGGLLDSNTYSKIFNEKQDSLDGLTQWTRTTGRDYYGKRTDGLLSPHEETDVVLDPLASISKGLENAGKTYAFDHYLNRAVEEWVRVAEGWIDEKSLAGTRDARSVFFNAKLNPQLAIDNPNIAAKLEENRVLIKRQMGMKTPSQERFDAAKRNLARFIENAGDATGTGKLATRAVMWADDVSSNNPINAINALVFDAWLGMGDVSQLWVQTQTLLTATAASPKYGAQAIGMFLPMRWLTVNKSDNLLDYIAKNTKTIHGQDPSDFKEMVKAYRASGWNAPGGEIAYLSSTSNSIGSAGAWAKINAGRRGLRLFFNEAERWNRIVAYQIAWKEVSENLPELAKNSKKFLAEVDYTTAKYSMNMTAISNSKIQQGVFSPMTRFMGYQFRLLEALLPKQVWGNPQFSFGAKGRMLGAQLVLYGAKGVPFSHKVGDLASDMYEQVVGRPLTHEESKFIESGAIDWLLYQMSDGELDTDLSERAGFGRGLDYTFQRASDGSMASALEAFGGPALSFSTRYAESVRRVLTYFKGTRGPLDLDPADAKFVFDELLVNHINSLKRAEKAIMIWRLGRVIDQKTGRPMFEATDLEGAAALLGIPLYEETEYYKQLNLLDKYDEEVKFNGQLLARLDREAFRLMSEGEFEQAAQVQKQAALILAQFQSEPGMQEDVARYATRELGFRGTQWDALVRRIESRLGPDEAPSSVRYEEDKEED